MVIGLERSVSVVLPIKARSSEDNTLPPRRASASNVVNDDVVLVPRMSSTSSLASMSMTATLSVSSTDSNGSSAPATSRLRGSKSARRRSTSRRKTADELMEQEMMDNASYCLEVFERYPPPDDF
eukprot:TRINITY_DN11356_c0_g1_i1.p2 TRINITY_DN11356_c0_g1~~TRINITY_DN11356_c0_g1_i1.p2  ORF type:complete len:125 (-),score=22.35 TRINITY_DN11356_c0_g1_i1:143-517(-)